MWRRVPDYVSCAGRGRSSVEASYTTVLDIEDVLSGAVTFVVLADVVISFDNVDRGVLDRVLSSLGLPAWFRHVYLCVGVRLRFKFAACPGELWNRDRGVPQGCSLRIVFIVALCVPWFRFLPAFHDSMLTI